RSHARLALTQKTIGSVAVSRVADRLRSSNQSGRIRTFSPAVDLDSIACSKSHWTPPNATGGRSGPLFQTRGGAPQLKFANVRQAELETTTATTRKGTSRIAGRARRDMGRPIADDKPLRKASGAAHAAPLAVSYFFSTRTAWTYRLRSYSPSLYASFVNAMLRVVSPFVSFVSNLYSFWSSLVSSKFSFTALSPTLRVSLAFSLRASLQEASMTIL